MEIDFTNNAHRCTSFIDGDWVIFRCPLCDGWELKLNPITLEMVRNAVACESLILHSGFNEGIDNLKALTQNLQHESNWWIEEIDSNAMGINCPAAWAHNWSDSNYNQHWFNMVKWMFVLSIFSSCTVGFDRGQYDFYFSWKQWEDTRHIGYCMDQNGHIFPYTDFSDVKGKKVIDWQYRKSAMYVGSGWIISKSEVNNKKILFPAKKFQPYESPN